MVNETLLQTPWNRRARKSEAESMSDPCWALGMQKGRGEKNQRLSHITKADTRRLPLTDHMTVPESVTLWWNKVPQRRPPPKPQNLRICDLKWQEGTRIAD